MSYDYLTQQTWGEGAEEKEVVEQYKNLFLSEADARANQVGGALMRELSSGITDEDKETVSRIAGRHLMEGFARVCKEVKGDYEKQNARYREDLTAQLHEIKRESKEKDQEVEKEKEAAIKEVEYVKSSLSSKIARLEKKLEEADERLEQREVEWQKREDDTDTAYEQSINEERGEKQEIAKILEQTRAERTEALERYESALHNYDEQVKETEWYKTDNKKAMEEMQIIAATQEKTRLMCVDLEEALADAKVKARQLEAEKEEPAKQFARRETELLNEIEENRHKIDELKRLLKDQKNVFEDKLKDTEDRVEDARGKIRGLGAETANLTKKLLGKELGSPEDGISSDNISKSQMKTSELQRDNEQLRAKLQEARERFGAHVAEMESRTDERNKQSEAIQEEVDRIRKRMTDFAKAEAEYKSNLEKEVHKNEALKLSLYGLKKGGTAADQIQKYAQDCASMRQENDLLRKENEELKFKLGRKLGGGPAFDCEEDKAEAHRILRLALQEVNAFEQCLVRIETEMQAEVQAEVQEEMQEEMPAYEAGGGVDHQRQVDKPGGQLQQTEQALQDNRRLTPALQQELETYQTSYEAPHELRRVVRQLLNYYDAVEKAMTDYLNQFDSASSSRAEEAQQVELEVFQEFMNRIMGGILQELTRCRAERDAGERSPGLRTKIARFEAELETLRTGISFTRHNTKLREALLQNRRHIGLADASVFNNFVHAQPPGSDLPPGNPAPNNYRTGWIVTAILVFFFLLDFVIELCGG